MPGNARGAVVALPDDPRTGKKGGHERMDQFKKRFKNDPGRSKKEEKVDEQLEKMIIEELYNVLSERDWPETFNKLQSAGSGIMTGLETPLGP